MQWYINPTEIILIIWNLSFSLLRFIVSSNFRKFFSTFFFPMFRRWFMNRANKNRLFGRSFNVNGFTMKAGFYKSISISMPFRPACRSSFYSSPTSSLFLSDHRSNFSRFLGIASVFFFFSLRTRIIKFYR